MDLLYISINNCVFFFWWHTRQDPYFFPPAGNKDKLLCLMIPYLRQDAGVLSYLFPCIIIGILGPCFCTVQVPATLHRHYKSMSTVFLLVHLRHDLLVSVNVAIYSVKSMLSKATPRWRVRIRLRLRPRVRSRLKIRLRLTFRLMVKLLRLWCTKRRSKDSEPLDQFTVASVRHSNTRRGHYRRTIPAVFSFDQFSFKHFLKNVILSYVFFFIIFHHHWRPPWPVFKNGRSRFKKDHSCKRNWDTRPFTLLQLPALLATLHPSTITKPQEDTASSLKSPWPLCDENKES